MRNFSKDVKIVPILSPIAAASADRTGTVVDTKGFAACCIVVNYGVIASGAVMNIKVAHADVAASNTALTNGSDISASSQTIADDADDKCFYIDFIEPTKRFLLLTINKDASNTSFESAVAYLYRSKDVVPVTHAAGSDDGDGIAAVSGELIVHPIDGTA